MELTIVHWHIEIGLFILNTPIHTKVSLSWDSQNLFPLWTLGVYTLVHIFFHFALYNYSSITLLLICGDAELNPGPKKQIPLWFLLISLESQYYTAYNFSKILLHNAQHKFDMICISETYVDSSFQVEYHDLYD